MMYHKDECLKLLKSTCEDRIKKRGETFFFYHLKMKEVHWGNNDELKIQMKIWKKQKKEGILTINKKNHRDFEINGRTYYTLTVTQTDCFVPPDPLGFSQGFLVTGMMYWFVRSENRDAVYQYVMK